MPKRVRNLNKQMLSALYLVFVFFMSATFLSSCKMASKETTKVEVKLPACRTGECHSDIGTKRYVHLPVRKGACVMCHKRVNVKHPGKSGDGARDFEIWGEEKALCYICHEQTDREKSVHEPVITGKCTSCHDPHQSDYPLRLTTDTKSETCFACHTEFKKKVDSYEYWHTPFKTGCYACHDSHGVGTRGMLKAAFPEKYNVAFNVDEYALCWRCHKKEMVLLKNTETSTRFRNGDDNLHYRHVNRTPKGKSCKACHDHHAGPQPMHIRSDIPFGGSDLWTQPIKFTISDTGGSCETGCHKEKAYDRAVPVEY